MTMALDGVRREWIQLGTVMTDEHARNRGLAAFLMKRVLEEWSGRCEAVYLFGNASARAFYPRFGFTPVKEYRTTLLMSGRAGRCRRLDMGRAEDRTRLLAAYRRSNPFSALRMEDNPGLLMFYCDGPLRDCLWVHEETGAVAVVEQPEDGILCYDIFGRKSASLEDILAPFVGEGRRPVRLGFPPAQPIGKAVCAHTEDETLFFLGESGRQFAERRLPLPLLPHA